MVYNLVFDKSVAKDLKLLSKQDSKKIIANIKTKLIQSPSSNKMLKGIFRGIYSYRMGDYRVLFSIKNNVVHVHKIGHRKSVYKK